MSKIWKSFLSITLLVMVLLPVNIKATSNEGFVIKNVAITSNDNPITPNSTLTINMGYDLVNTHKGEVITVTLPKELMVTNGFTFPIKTDNGVIVGEATVNQDNTMSVDLTDPSNYLVTHDDIHGTISFQADFNSNIVNKPGTYPLTFKDDNSQVTTNITVEKHQEVIPPKNQLVVKWGEVLNRNTIRWTVRIDFAKAHLTQAHILEQLGPGQNVIENSVHIYQCVFDKYGNPTSQVDVTDMIHKVITNTSISADFGDIHKGYMLVFDSHIDNQNQESFSNHVVLTADNTVAHDDSSVVSLMNGIGNISGNQLYNLTINKIDEQTKKPLSGAVFTLYDNNMQVIFDNLTTDSVGNLVVNYLPNGTYYVQETKAPINYVLDKELIKVIINNQNQTITISNKMNLGIGGAGGNKPLNKPEYKPIIKPSQTNNVNNYKFNKNNNNDSTKSSNKLKNTNSLEDLGNTNTGIVATYDTQSQEILPLILLMILSLGLIVIVIRKRRK